MWEKVGNIDLSEFFKPTASLLPVDFLQRIVDPTGMKQKRTRSWSLTPCWTVKEHSSTGRKDSSTPAIGYHSQTRMSNAFWALPLVPGVFQVGTSWAPHRTTAIISFWGAARQRVWSHVERFFLMALPERAQPLELRVSFPTEQENTKRVYTGE